MIKRKSLIWLTVACLFLSFTGAAISLSNSKASSQISYAETTAFDTAQAVSVSGATVTAGADKSGSVPHKGLLVEPVEEKGSYSGTLNAILPENSTFTYNFPGTLNGDGSAKRLDFTLRFTSVAEPSKYFELVHSNAGWHGWYNSLYARDMNGNVRAKGYEAGFWNFIDDMATITNDSSNILYLPYYGGDNTNSGSIQTLRENGKMYVYALGVTNWKQCITILDSDTYTALDNDKQICGFEKIDFSQGYILSFSANSSNGEATAPLLIESINGQSFENATWEAEPSWYTSYASIPMITLSGEIAEGYTVEDPFIVPAATYSSLNDPTEKSVAKIELQKDGGEWQSVSVGGIISEVGSYAIKYTAKEGGIALGNTLEKSFRVLNEYFDMKDAVAVTGATVTAGADKSGSVAHKGLLIEPESTTGSYSGTLNAVLPANSTFSYNFPGTLGDGTNNYAKYIDFTLRFTSVAEPSKYFELVHSNARWHGWFNSLYARDMNGNVRAKEYEALSHWTFIDDMATITNDSSNILYLPFYGGNDNNSGTITTEYIEGKMYVYALGISGWKQLITVLDSDTYTALDNDKQICGFEKIDFSQGFILSFSANSSNGEATAPLLLEKINGISLTDKFIPAFTQSHSFNEDGVVYSNGREMVNDLDLDAVFNYSATLGTLTFNVSKTVSPTGLELSQDNVSTLTYTCNGRIVERQVSVYVNYVYGASVSTKGDIALNFYVVLSDSLINSENSYVEFDFNGTKNTIVFANGVSKNGYYVFTYYVPAKDYSQNIILNVYANGTCVDSVTYSVATYAQKITDGNYSNEVKQLVGALVDYCECARAYFAAESVEAKFTDITADTLSGYASSTVGTAPEGINIIGASLVLNSKTSIRVYFSGENAETATVMVDGVTSKVKLNTDNGYYYVEIANISAKDLDTVHTIVIGEYELTYSALSYVYENCQSDNVALANVVKAMYVYNQKADAYVQSLVR